MQFEGGPNGNFTGYGFSDFLMGQESFFDQGGGESNIAACVVSSALRR